MPGKPGSVKERFWSKVAIGKDCWEWQAQVGPHGYGCFDHRFAYRAHRASWILTFGAIPKGMQVLHRCDNKRCVRPDHLFLGTQKENVVDCVNKGRISRGEHRPQHKLTTDNIRAIRDLRKTGLTYKTLAERFNVSLGYICKIVNGTAWRHVENA